MSKFCPQCGSDKLKTAKSDVTAAGRARYRCSVCKTRTTRPLTQAPQVIPKFKKEDRQVYIVTHAANDTPLIPGFLKTLESIAKRFEAQLIVMAGVYKNPDMVKKGFLESLSWPSEILKYICQKDVKIGKHLIIRGATRIEHCAINPLNGMNHSAGTFSEVFGHPQLAMECLPTPKNETPRMLITTGTLSQRNYGGSPRAKKASFHHNNSALLIETIGNRFWIRPLSWGGDHIQDLHTVYTPDGKCKKGTVDAIAYGDLHVDAMTKDEKNAVLQLQELIKPVRTVMHDVLDMHSGSHHKAGNVLHNMRVPEHDVAGELKRTCDYLRLFKNECLIVSSNHHDHLDRWFNEMKPSIERINLATYYLLGDLARQYSGSLFELYCKHIAKLPHKFINEDAVYDINGIDVSQHGHRGPNGSRGSGKSFAKTGRRTITGHSHTPAINKGNWVVGTSAMHLEYAHGYSSWLEHHIIVYPSGKRSFIIRVKKRYSPSVEAL